MFCNCHFWTVSFVELANLTTIGMNKLITFFIVCTAGTHIITMILIEGFNHEITPAQLRLSEIVVKYSRPSCGAQFSKHFQFSTSSYIASWLEILEKPDIRFSSSLKCLWNEFSPLLFVTGKYANLRICIKILLKKTHSVRKSLFQLPVRPWFMRQFIKDLRRVVT